MKKILVVVDMQNDFITGNLGTKEACAIVDRVKEKIEQYIKKDWEVVFTRDTHTEEYLTTQEGKYLPVIHCVKNTEGWQIIPQIQKFTEGRKIFDKPSFGSMELARYIQEGRYEQAEFIGVCTDICVVSNALLTKTYVPEAEIFIDTDCCAGVTPESHNSAICTMKMCQIQIKNKNNIK
nr:isochorismatase family cysteine hydrolase [uncultured Sellimonas sp.]